MKILVIDDEWPSAYSGKALRIINIFKRIVGQDSCHFLYLGNKSVENINLYSFFSSISEVAVPQLKKSFLRRLINSVILRPGDDVRLSNPSAFMAVKKAINKIIREKNIDTIHVFSFFTAQFLVDCDGARKVWDVGDSLYLDHLRRAKLDKTKQNLKFSVYARKIFSYEREMISRYDKTIFVSEKDGAVHSYFKNKISIFPNGVDLDYFKPMESREDFPSLVFTGHMRFLPNVQAVEYFVKSIFPLVRKFFPTVKFNIVGAEPVPEIIALNGQNGVIVTGAVDDVRPYLAKANVFVSPMISGGGIKNKLLQAMAMAKPVVSTSLGTEALSFCSGSDILIGDTPQEFAQRVIELLSDSEKRSRLSNNGRALIEKEYDWSGVIAKYRSLYRSLTKGSS